MHKVLIIGAGKIGGTIAWLLSRSGDYEVWVGDAHPEALARLQGQSRVKTIPLDATHREALAAAMHGRDSVVSALSYHFNPRIAEVAVEQGLSYFDLTEDRQTATQVRRLAARAPAGVTLMPQCGLAPGFISVLAHHLTRSFDTLDKVLMRVGALPQFPSNMLKYNLTWSTDGLINEYCNPCEAIRDGKRLETLPLEELEHFSLDGIHYEAFNTSGGLGTLCETLDGKVKELNYKTIRYLGHRDLMAFLVRELKLGQRRNLLKDILENAVPITFQDVVVIFCTVTGRREGQLVQSSDARKIYSTVIDGEPWSAIQITTAASLCAVLDLHVEGKLPQTGFVRQEDVELDDFLANRFGAYYRSQVLTRFSQPTTDAGPA